MDKTKAVQLTIFTVVVLLLVIGMIGLSLPLPPVMSSKWQWLVDPLIYFLILAWPIFVFNPVILGLVVFVLVAGWFPRFLFAKRRPYLIIFCWVLVGGGLSWIEIAASI